MIPILTNCQNEKNEDEHASNFNIRTQTKLNKYGRVTMKRWRRRGAFPDLLSQC